MTKGELASRILKLIGVNTRFSEGSPEEVQDVLGYLEDYMLASNAIGRRLGYHQADGVPNPNEESGVPDWAVMGITNAMAIYVAPYFDKQVHPAIARNASQGMATIQSKTAQVLPVQYPSRFPRGSAQGGAKYYQPSDRIQTSNDFLTDDGETITP